MKTVEEIYREMMDRFSQETGMEPNGTGEMAVRMYALAAQVYGLYEELAWTCRQCFPQTATGEELEKHGFLRGIARNPARQASGTLRFSVQEAVEEDLEIAQGTVCMTAGLVAFETTQAGVLPAGELSVDLPAQAVEPGPGGNVSAGTVRTMAVAPVGVAACTNPVPFTGGREEEGDEELRARILATYQQLPNGTNGAYYAQEALAVEGVTAVRVLPKNRGMGTVDVIIAGVEGLPGEELLRQVQERLEQKREIAVDVAVLAPEPVAVRLILSVKPKPGLLPGPVIARVQEAMETWFDGSMLGRDLLLAQIGQRIYQVAEQVALLQREMNLYTAQAEGLTGLLELLGLERAGETLEELRQTVAALLRIGGDSFTLAAMNDTLRGCGIPAQVEETEDPLEVVVSFPGVEGIPAGFEQTKARIEEILPCHLLVKYQFSDSV